MSGPETEGGVDSAPDDVARPGTGVARPGTGVVRPGSVTGAAGSAGVVRPGAARPGTDVVRPDGAGDSGAKAVAAVPEAPPEQPVEPIHVVLPVIPVKPAKQGFLDRLVAGKSDAEKAEEAARKAEEAARKEEEARRRAEETQRKADEKALREREEADRRAAEKARKEEWEARREAQQARRAEAEAERKARAEAEEKARKQAEKARREQQKAEEKARREQERALRRADDDFDDDYDEDEYDDEEYGEPGRVLAPPRPAPARPGPAAPPRPGPSAPPRPAPRPVLAPARPMPDRRAPQRVAVYEDAQLRRRPLWHWVVAAMALVALGGGSAVVAVVVAPPASVSYQAGIDTGDQAPILGGLDGSAPLPSRPGLEAALGPLVASTNLGPNPAVTVADAATGELLWDRRGDLPVKPASSAKVLTAAAVLTTRGPNYRIPTRVVAGANPGDVVLVGGGDPTLGVGDVAYFRGAARLDDLAKQVRDALGGQAPSRVLIDGSLFSGSQVGPSGSGNVGTAVANVTALMIDGGRSDPSYHGENPHFVGQPDVAAGRAFARALGVPESSVTPGSAPADADMLGEVLSPPIATIVEQMLAQSDNTVAEMMARQVALAKDMEASFAGGAQAIHEVLGELGVPMPPGTGLQDGSGLSHNNRESTNHLIAVMLKAASPDYPQLHPILTGLAVAGYSGTMDDAHRRGDAGRGTVRAKTGTLNGVNALVGFLVDADGRLLAFAAIGNDTPNEFVAEPALDRIAERLTRCGCS